MFHLLVLLEILKNLIFPAEQFTQFVPEMFYDALVSENNAWKA